LRPLDDRRADAVEQALLILRRERRLFDAVVAALIEMDDVTDGQVDELARELLTTSAQRK
jgi:hypothetical protein